MECVEFGHSAVHPIGGSGEWEYGLGTGKWNRRDGWEFLRGTGKLLAYLNIFYKFKKNQNK